MHAMHDNDACEFITINDGKVVVMLQKIRSIINPYFMLNGPMVGLPPKTKETSSNGLTCLT